MDTRHFAALDLTNVVPLLPSNRMPASLEVLGTGVDEAYPPPPPRHYVAWTGFDVEESAPPACI